MDERVARGGGQDVTTDELDTSRVVMEKKHPSAAPPAGISSGMTLEGKYVVGKVVGTGAVGLLFEALNVELDEKVAIKCLRPEMLVDRVMVGRFAREAKAAATIKSEYVATVQDVGTTDDGIPYMVMEYLDGKDLGSVVADSGTLPVRTAVEVALQVCEALAVAHAMGIIHRDIKPENLLLTERVGGMRIVKVLDFGISKAALTGSIFQTELSLLDTHDLVGSPLYMSPEQMRTSDNVDARSDIWSLGMVLYEILTGHTAFKGHSVTAICGEILESAPDPIELHRTDLPPGLADVILRCLEKDAAARFQNIAELALALMPFGPKRTRLNVERAIAVLQGRGKLDPSIKINSTIPPSSFPAELGLQSTPIPRAPSLPGIPTIPAPPSHPPAAVAPPSPKAPVALLAAGLGVLLVGVAAMVMSIVDPRQAPAPAAAAASVGPAVAAPSGSPGPSAKRPPAAPASTD